MPSYQTLDTIADIYTPLLAIAALAVLLRPPGKLQWQVLGARMARLAAGALVAYGLMFLDNWLQVWPAFGMDYSTHTAVALVLAMFIAVNAPKARWWCWISLLAYAVLMLAQRYHTAADIVTTALAAGVLYLPAVMERKRASAR
jgi:hypothetical protein